MATAIEVTSNNHPVVIENKTPNDVDPKTVLVDPNRRLKSDLADIIFLHEQVGKVIAKLKDELKDAAVTSRTKFIDGEHYTVGQIKAGAVPTAIDVSQFLNHCKQANLPDEEVFACLTVGKEAAKQIVPEKVLEAMSIDLPAKSPSLQFAVAAGTAQPSVKDALQIIADFFAKASSGKTGNGSKGTAHKGKNTREPSKKTKEATAAGLKNP